MKFEEAIHVQYGVRVPVTPCDLKLRKFKIDELRNGFLMKSDKNGVFGSFIDGEMLIWDEKQVTLHTQQHKERKDISFEWLIWEGARSMLERGERLSREDGERLALAVKRLEMWL